MRFREYITQKYSDWRGNAYGHEKTVEEFAIYIGVSQSTMTGWLNGKKKPKIHRTIMKLIDKFGYEIYGILEIEPPRPNPIVEGIEKSLPKNIPPELQGQLLEDHKQFIREWASKYGIPIKDRDT